MLKQVVQLPKVLKRLKIGSFWDQQVPKEVKSPCALGCPNKCFFTILTAQISESNLKTGHFGDQNGWNRHCFHK